GSSFSSARTSTSRDSSRSVAWVTPWPAIWSTRRGERWRRRDRARLEVERLGNQLVGAPPGLVVVGDRHHDDLLGAVLDRHRLDLGPHLLRRAHDRPPAGPATVQRLALALEELDRLLGWRHRDQLVAAQQRERHPAAGGEVDGLVVRGRGERPYGDGGLGRLQGAARLEALAVELGDLGTLGVDEVRERIGEPELARPDRALGRGAQQPGEIGRA